MGIFRARKEKKEAARRQAEEEARRQAEEAAKVEAKARADAERSFYEKSSTDIELEKKAYVIAMKAGRYQEAIDHLENLGQMGNADAYNALAEMYHKGTIVEKSPTKVFEYAKKSMELGSGSGAMLTALAYHSGRGVKQDCRKALEAIHIALDRHAEGAEALYEKMLATYAETDTDEIAAHAFADGTRLASEGRYDWYASLMRIVYELHSDRYSGSGAFSLYLSYRDGDGVKQDPAEAKKWLMRAADFGLANDNGALAYELYKNAETIDELKLAIRWTDRAAEKAQPESERGRALASLRQLLEDKISASQATAAYNAGQYDIALPVFRELAGRNNPSAAYYTARMYQDGKGVEKNAAEGMAWMGRAADLGSGMACLYMAGVRYKGTDTQPPDKDAALFFAERALATGELEGQYKEAAEKLAEMLRPEPEPEPEEPEPDIEQLKQDADKGDVLAMTALAEEYISGKWIPKDRKRALMWAQRAIQSKLIDLETRHRLDEVIQKVNQY